MMFNFEMPTLVNCESVFVCPRTKQPLYLKSVEETQAALGAVELFPRRNDTPVPFGATPQMLVPADGRYAYPIVDGVPILLAPEQITTAEHRRDFDLEDVRYAEAYQEMAHYNEVGRREAFAIRESQAFQVTEAVWRLSPEQRRDYPDPKEVWADCVPDCAAQYEAYRHLRPIEGKRVLQLGGKGIHAAKFLLAGAAEAWVITPMLGEALCSIALAREVGVLDRLRCVVGVAEELPLADNLFDAIYSGSCVHHMTTELALPEAARVLKPGGRFSAAENWRAPFYGIGTRLLGKREPNVFCRPLNRARVAPLFASFSNAEKVQHGTLVRYPAIALSKLGIHLSFRTMWQLYRFDDAFCSLIPGMRNLGSGVALLATK